MSDFEPPPPGGMMPTPPGGMMPSLPPQPAAPPPPHPGAAPTPPPPTAPVPPGYQAYSPPNPSGLPPGVTLTSPWARLGAYLLEFALVLMTLVIGWLVWAAILAGNGQTPAKKLLGQRVVLDSGSEPCGFARMLFGRGLLGGIVAQFAIVFTLGILLFMPFWDRRNQNLWDKITGTVVVDDPNNAWGVS